jgi:hypothetical protein
MATINTVYNFLVGDLEHFPQKVYYNVTKNDYIYREELSILNMKYKHESLPELLKNFLEENNNGRSIENKYLVRYYYGWEKRNYDHHK